jgi:hypothetical protein
MRVREDIKKIKKGGNTYHGWPRGMKEVKAEVSIGWEV